MKKTLSILLVVVLFAGHVWAKELALVFSRKAWKDVSSTNKQKARDEFLKCTRAPKAFKVRWDYLKGTNEWCVVNFAHGAWVLKQKESIGTNKIEKIKTFLGNNPQVFLYWTDDLKGELSAAGITNKATSVP